jgi:hypothetical protein
MLKETPLNDTVVAELPQKSLVIKGSGEAMIDAALHLRRFKTFV